MRRIIYYLPLVILIFLGGVWAGRFYLEPRSEAPSKLKGSVLTKSVSEQEANPGCAEVLPSPASALPRSQDGAPGLEAQPAEKILNQLPPQQKSSRKLPRVLHLTQEDLDETAALLRQGGLPEEDIEGLLEGQRARLSIAEGPFPVLQDLPPEERVAEIRNNLKDSGIPPEDLEAIAEGFSRRIESMKQSSGTRPLSLPAVPK